MTTFGVHSEVGALRKVMVHRPDLSLQRLTPSNHDELLFDDVLWVERAQLEHDRFVAKMRERGVEVFLLQDLLREVRRQLRPLERQAEAARRHGDLVGELTDLRIFVAGRELESLKRKLDNAAAQRVDMQQAERDLKTRLADLDTRVMAT